MIALRTRQILQISIRNFLRFRLQAALIVIASMTGTAGVLVSAGYAASGRQKILDQFTRLGANVLVLTPQQSRSVGGRARTGALITTLIPADRKAIELSVSSLASSSPTVSAVLRIRVGDLTKNTTIVGCEPVYFTIKHWTAGSGEIFDVNADRRQSRVALLGWTVARDLFGAADPTGEFISINRVPFHVAGVMRERGQGLDASNEDEQIYVPLGTAMHRLENLDYYASILFEVDDSSHMDAAATQITEVMEQRHRRLASGEPDYQIQNRKSLIDTQLASFARLTFLIRWVASSALAVSMLGVFAVTWIGVRNRTREVGTRRALGATRADILFQFFAEGSFGAVLGCSAGVASGYLALRYLDLRAGQPFLLSTTDALLEAAVSMAFFAMFTLASAIRGIRIEPVRALRTE
ncbi:ABC transporter permease [Acidicapsa acidisoli]|uniref:ABC transporter permease n=1 Tax=Acidicapsa acidisoli TaxID=1615681 RepID=UPI0021E071F8|nr:ABC transporter permease [Acidicapsa acidisoli]